MVNQIVSLDSEVDKPLEKKKNQFDFTKIFTKRNLKIFLLLIIAVFGLIIYFGMTSSETESRVVKDVSNNSYRTTMQYCAELEAKLQSVLSNIRGAGEVDVMITVDGSPELIYASDVDEKVSSNSSGTTTSSTSSSPIIINVGGNSNALILTESLPQVKGVIIVSSGAGNVSVKLDILNAVSTLLDISTDKISVLKGI